MKLTNPFSRDELVMIQAALTMANGIYDHDFLPWKEPRKCRIDLALQEKLSRMLHRPRRIIGKQAPCPAIR
jgi:hypothetical protein